MLCGKASNSEEFQGLLDHVIGWLKEKAPCSQGQEKEKGVIDRVR